MRLPESAHQSRPWRIHEIAWDFGLEDVWLIPGTGAHEDFDRVLAGLAEADPSESPSLATR